MSYIRHNISNVQVDPQPGFSTVTLFGVNEGWSSLSYRDYNSDYVRHDENNNPIGIGTYQRHDLNNTQISVETYQRHDLNNNPVLQ